MAPQVAAKMRRITRQTSEIDSSGLDVSLLDSDGSVKAVPAAAAGGGGGGGGKGGARKNDRKGGAAARQVEAQELPIVVKAALPREKGNGGFAKQDLAPGDAHAAARHSTHHAVSPVRPTLCSVSAGSTRCGFRHVHRRVLGGGDRQDIRPAAAGGPPRLTNRSTLVHATTLVPAHTPDLARRHEMPVETALADWCCAAQGQSEYLFDLGGGLTIDASCQVQPAPSCRWTS